jgi:hypothetical protein
MPSYRFYKIGGGNHIVAPGEDHDFDCDAPALAHAKALANGYSIEVWRGSQFVAQVPAETKSPRVEGVAGTHKG